MAQSRRGPDARARCGCCGGGFAGHSRAHGQQRVHFYGCTSHWKRGGAVCLNGLAGRQEAIDAEVLAVLEQDILRPSVIEQAIGLALEELAPARQDEQRQALEREQRSVQAECDRLAEALGMGVPMAALVARLQARQARLEELNVAVRAEASQRRQVDTRAGWERRLREKLGDVTRLLRGDLEEARNVLRVLLIVPLRFTPVVEERRRGYRFEGAIAPSTDWCQGSWTCQLEWRPNGIRYVVDIRAAPRDRRGVIARQVRGGNDVHRLGARERPNRRGLAIVTAVVQTSV